ncbi:type II secretion system minor pseudopilin GspJ [Allosphingosinicella vermicomposti]|uniref:type II secretion system minor pseudopilin GspJ n=1 Tax=Allosphingosinicella vermicomposti TaxID=614671 RepID=UPI0024781284|nr:type II secretion system minor pseudopilin GspJ [Allosphingosinicella vermicomposti]
MRGAQSRCSCKSRNPTAQKPGLPLSQEHNAREAGFTIVELLVALLIFGMLSAAGVALLSFSVNTQDRAAERMEELSGLRRMGALLTGDLAQVVPRIARDEEGRPRAAFEGGNGSGLLFTFVRAGWDNPGDAPRGTLQKVDYRLSGTTLERVAYPHVDGAFPLDPVALVQNVRAVRVRFRDANGAWLDRWLAERATDLPRAVELEVDTERDGRLRQLFLVGGA